MTFYLKYRPQRFDELDLEDVRNSLIKIISSNNIPHAFLFSGPKGTGKTSAARILAKAINCESASLKLRGSGEVEPCNQCSQCKSITRGENLDVIEIDAASHRGIDDVRMLRDAVKLAPTGSKKKIYIIDEAHMLTNEASNALLKTLEEPPEHVIFILATTNPEKLISTIKSRVLNINFNKASDIEIERSLEKVVKGERLKIDKESLKLIANYSDGSFRDATKILEQLITEKIKLDKENITKCLSKIENFDVDKFLLILLKGDAHEAILEIEDAVKKGIAARNLTESIISRLRGGLLAEIGLNDNKIKDASKNDIILLIKSLTESLHDIPVSLIDHLPLEIAVVEWCEKVLSNGNNMNRISGDKSENTLDVSTEKKSYTLKDRNNKEGDDVREEISYQSPINGQSSSISDELWAQILLLVRPKNASTEALLRAAKPIGFDGKVLTLGVYYSFHKEKLEVNPHRMILEETVSTVVGGPVRISCTLVKPPEKIEISEKKEDLKSKEIINKDLVLTEGDDDDIIKVAKEIFNS